MDIFNSDSLPTSIVRDAIRTLGAFLDRGVFGLLMILFQIFFNVASADLFSNATILKFYGRVQLLLGILMMFQLALVILKGILNPDNFDKEFSGEKGFISRVVVVLIMFAVLTPISIPNASNEYEKQINNNGILFGTLYSLQHRMLANNTLGRLILGTTEDESTYINSGDNDSLVTTSKIITSTIVKVFYRINLIPSSNSEYKEPTDGKDPATINDNRVCKHLDQDLLDQYTRIDADPWDIINMNIATCETDDDDFFLVKWYKNLKRAVGAEYYMLSYTPFISAIVGGIFCFIMISFTIDIAVRAVKLAVLRLIAPVPVISYLNPQGKTDGAFGSWVKTLMTTYIDLFIRIAVIYFIIFLMQDMIANGIVINSGSGVIGGFSIVFIWIGLLVFAKQAPKFIKDALGLKGDGFKMFGGIGEALGAVGSVAGLGAAAVGSVGAVRAGMKASRLADETRQAFGRKDIFGNDVDPNSITNRGKHILAGIAGGIGGFGAASKAALTSKEKNFGASMQALSKHNTDLLTRGNSGSTMFGRLNSMGQQIITGDGLSSAGERNISSLKSKKDALSAVKSRMSGEMVKQDWTYGNLGIATDNAGNAIKSVNYKSFMAQYEQSRAAGRDYVEFTDVTGASHQISFAQAEMQKGFLLKNNEDFYVQHATSVSNISVDGVNITSKQDIQLVDLIADARAKGATVTNRDSITTNGIDAYERDIRAAERENVINKADDSFAGKK